MSKRVLTGVLCLAIGGAALVMTGCPKDEKKDGEKKAGEPAKAPAGETKK